MQAQPSGIVERRQVDVAKVSLDMRCSAHLQLLGAWIDGPCKAERDSCAGFGTDADVMRAACQLALAGSC